jgi:hypothetical protein
MSDLQGRRIPGEEDSGRRRPLLWIILGLILLLLLAVLIPFACQSMNGDSGQQGGGSGAQGGSEGSDRDGGKETENAKADEAGAGGAQNGGQPDGGQGDGGQGGGGQSASEEPQDVATARLSARDQGGDGETVTVPAATLEGTKGWLAVRANDGGEPGEVLGYSPLQAGTNNDVEVELDRPVDSSQRLYTTVHQESPADGKFTFPADDPTATRGGQAAVEPIYYTVNDGASGRANAGIRDDELPESGGIPPGALLAAGALLLASSVAGFSLALRLGSEIGR